MLINTKKILFCLHYKISKLLQADAAGFLTRYLVHSNERVKENSDRWKCVGLLATNRSQGDEINE